MDSEFDSSCVGLNFNNDALKTQSTTLSDPTLEALKRVNFQENCFVNGARRERSSLSESHLTSEESAKSYERRDHKTLFECRQRKSKSLYGAPPSSKFGPKASLLKNQDTTLTIQEPGNQMLQWYKPPQSILVIKKIWDNNVDEPFLQLVSWLVKEKQMKVFIENRVLEDSTIFDNQLFSGPNEQLTFFKEGEFDLTGQVDFIICLGGDGTLLYASSLFQSSVPPVLAFHFGSLGFLSPFDFSDFKHEVDRVLEGVHVGLVLRTRLKCEIFRGGIHDDTFYAKKPTIRGVESKNHVLALNEVVVDRGDTPYLCQLDLFIDDMLVTVVQGDGLIISTPTGSTAYAAAAGASMVHPNVPAIVITPICPHSLSFRPIVVPAGVEIKVMVSPDARSHAWVSFDGRSRQQLQKNDVLMISTSKYPLPSLCKQNPINDWFGSLAGCLHWNVRKTQSSFSLPFSSDNNTSNSESGESINGH